MVKALKDVKINPRIKIEENGNVCFAVSCRPVSYTHLFFEYDFARPSWDDEAQSMTGKPLKMHLEHGFDMEKCRRASWVDEHLRATPSVVKWTKDYFIDRYKSLPEMPYHVERIHFEKRAEYSTEGKFMHMLTPVSYTHLDVYKRQEMSGGTFTVSNLGMFGLDEFTAIINTPESGILALGAITKTPVVIGDEIVIRPIMSMTLTYDHRIVDGAPAAQFLGRVKQYVEEPTLML